MTDKTSRGPIVVAAGIVGFSLGAVLATIVAVDHAHDRCAHLLDDMMTTMSVRKGMAYVPQPTWPAITCPTGLICEDRR